MNARKGFVLGLTVILLIGLIWYFLIKDYNYKITFETPHAPGTVYSSLNNTRQWQNSDFDSISITKATAFKNITYNLFVGDSALSIDWKIKRINGLLLRFGRVLSDPLG